MTQPTDSQFLPVSEIVAIRPVAEWFCNCVPESTSSLAISLQDTQSLHPTILTRTIDWTYNAPNTLLNLPRPALSAAMQLLYAPHHLLTVRRSPTHDRRPMPLLNQPKLQYPYAIATSISASSPPLSIGGATPNPPRYPWPHRTPCRPSPPPVWVRDRGNTRA